MSDLARAVDAATDASHARQTRADDFDEWFKGEVDRRAHNLMGDTKALNVYLVEHDLISDIEIEIGGEKVLVLDAAVWMLNCTLNECDAIRKSVRNAIFATLIADSSPIVGDLEKELEECPYDVQRAVRVRASINEAHERNLDFIAHRFAGE